LQEFIPGGNSFTYKVTKSWGTLAEWKNTYTLNLKPFEWKGQNLFKLNLTETITIYVTTDSVKMDEYKKQVKDAYNATQNTPAMIAARERWKAEKLKKAQELKDEYYYNNKNEIFQVKIWYVTGPQSTEYYANYIDTALRLLGVKTELIPFGPKDIQSLITSGERNYDILVIGVSVEWSLSSIGKLFLSSESKTSWVNFSNVENKTLDSLFTALRSTTEPSKREKIEQNIEKIMNTESFFLPISSPYHRIWVDRNIKWIPKVDIIPDVASFVDIFIGTSIKENYVRNMQDKSISGFFLWIWSKL
jgi:ABC-type transport system substrate-binding protein